MLMTACSAWVIWWIHTENYPGADIWWKDDDHTASPNDFLKSPYYQHINMNKTSTVKENIKPRV